eukprot:Gregarina_sp_Pseudo_9__5652@NODE_793_length_2208_cov_47_026740_g747_i0_p1_GENE_NODE_793_length_2208_cov_47_026740_g747_i0NODE_793_length_2208_cov_47_026740_g747_i0_p1_ORF_typecomplete_len244_score63_96PhoPQ_related/PF10142_9/0_0047_NODE_793_length_2208_cov_47_026740_g747_i013792110
MARVLRGLLAVACVCVWHVQGRRTSALQLHARLAEVHKFDCATANTDACQAKCEQSTHCATDMTDRAQYRQCFLDLGSDCGVLAELHRRTNRTSHQIYEVKTEGTEEYVYVRSAVADTFEGPSAITTNADWNHFLRVWVPNARDCDGVSTTIVGGSVGSSSSKKDTATATAIADDVLQFDTTVIWAASGYGAGFNPLPLSACIPDPQAFGENKEIRLEQWYTSNKLFRVWGTDTLNHLSLYEP